YFWDYDVAMNSPNPKYQRQSWIGLWNPSSKLLDVAGVNYVFWSGPLEDPRLEEVERHACGRKFSCYVYRNKNALPRAFLAKRVEHFSSGKALLSRLQEVDFDLREAVTTEDQTLSDKFQA